VAAYRAARWNACHCELKENIMRKVFPGYYRPVEQELIKLWKNCVFVLDANVLLNLYRYSEEARRDLLRIFQKVSDRLWIPHQAALEYQENRLSVIAEQVQRYDEVEDVLTKTQNKLRMDLGNLQLKKRHSTIDPDTFLTKVESVFDEFISNLKDLQKGQPDVFDRDELRDEIGRLIKGKIGEPPKSQQQLDEIYKEGERRYANRLPPGYMDKLKSQDGRVYYHRGLAFKSEYGDLILWREIIENAKNDSRFKYIIFITDDAKEDWWWIVKSKGNKTIGPRPELVDEITSEAGVESFFMYSSLRFMELAKSYLQIQVQQKSIEQVRNIAQLADLELSYREIEVLRLVQQQGMRNKEIADELGLSSGTVRNYLSSAYSKLGATNRMGAVIMAVKLGLLPSPHEELTDQESEIL